MSSRKLIFSVILCGLALLYLAVACGGGAEQTPTPPTVVMTPGGGEGPAAPSGDELLQSRCAECHGLAQIEGASKTQAEWETTVARMRSKGAQLTDGEAETLVEFLAETYGP